MAHTQSESPDVPEVPATDLSAPRSGREHLLFDETQAISTRTVPFVAHSLRVAERRKSVLLSGRLPYK
jgi:hypothetical protein